MSLKPFRPFLWLLACCFVSTTQNAQAGFAFVETTTIDLSDNNLLPTVLGVATVGTNVNTVSGNTGIIRTGSVDPDIFSFEVPAGFVLDAIRLTQFTTTSNTMFMSLAAGTTYPYSAEQIAAFPNMQLVLGSALVGTGPRVSVGDNLLTEMATRSAAQQMGPGFIAPLPAGFYSVYIQETGNSSIYSLSFNVSAVPEPSLFSLIGFVTLCGLHRRRTG